MAYSYDFKDNVVYGADHINAIRASFLTKGIVEECATSCLAEMDGSDVKIMPGQAIFNDGCCIKVDEEGVKLTPVSGAKNYIYFYNNTLAGVCEVLVGTTAPQNDFVMIAELEETGTLVDKREFVQLKTADAERYAASFSAELVMRDNMAAGDVIGEIQLPKNNCSYIEFDMRFGTLPAMQVRVFPKENGRVIWNYQTGDVYIADELSISYGGKTRTMSFEVSGNKLIVRFVSVSSASADQTTMKIYGVCMR